VRTSVIVSEELTEGEDDVVTGTREYRHIDFVPLGKLC
jgi:hypothetical protein